MKTLTVKILGADGQEVAWLRMSSKRMLDEAIAESGGPLAASLNLPSEATDITTLGCLAAAAAQDAGLNHVREWTGQWELEHSTPEARESEAE